MEAKCYRCIFLKEEDSGIVPMNWVSNKHYTCVKGRFAIGKDYRQWFALSGIVKPNKTVRLAQTNCPLFQEKGI